MPRGPSAFELPAPNQGASTIADLRHGRSEYEAEQTAYWKQLTAYHRALRNNDALPAPPTPWRETVRDQWALIPIYADPELILPGYNRPHLYNPNLLYECLFDVPRLIQVTHSAIEVSGGTQALRRVQGVLLSVFQQEFKMASLAAEPALDWKRATKFFELTVDLISRWLLYHYDLFPLFWGPLVAQYAEISPAWQDAIEQASRQAAIQEGRLKTFTPRLRT